MLLDLQFMDCTGTGLWHNLHKVDRLNLAYKRILANIIGMLCDNLNFTRKAL